MFERHVGGNIYDWGVDGSECRWARVLAYEPPDRVVFSWDISPRWQLESDPEGRARSRSASSRVARAHRVELEHRHLDRHGDGWEELRESVGSDEGWPLYLDRYLGLIGAGR